MRVVAFRRYRLNGASYILYQSHGLDIVVIRRWQIDSTLFLFLHIFKFLIIISMWQYLQEIGGNICCRIYYHQLKLVHFFEVLNFLVFLCGLRSCNSFLKFQFVVGNYHYQVLDVIVKPLVKAYFQGIINQISPIFLFVFGDFEVYVDVVWVFLLPLNTHQLCTTYINSYNITYFFKLDVPQAY